jgi:hypothetical protein
MDDDRDEMPGQADLFDVDAHLKGKGETEKEPGPLYRVYKGSRIPVSKSVGTLWKRRFDAGLAAYEAIYQAWDQAFMYYNNNQTKDLQTPRGQFSRGDGTENIVYSNLNVMLPAVYSKDPDIAINTVDAADDDFVSVLKSLINVLLSGRHLMNAKPKIKKAVGMALLTNFGVLKLDYIKKDDSREMAMQQMLELTDKLVKCKDASEAEEVYGQIEALEDTMEVYKQSGPDLGNVLPHNLIIDPNAEDIDAMDASWMIERIFFNTEALTAQYTEPCDETEEGGQPARNLTYKPTHKASFANTGGKRDDALGMVMTALSDNVTEFEDEARRNFRSMYYTECYLVWDKTTRRVMLYHRDDWTWPIWVWDDPLQISRFFPYFIVGFGMSTGGTVTVGETSYYLDQQDEINDINRQVGKIRRTIFDYFFYNADATNSDEVEKFVNALRGNGGPNEPHLLGVRAGEKKLSDMVEAFAPPSLAKEYEPFFNKEPILQTINRISNTSDALRGTQFKTNTNEAAVQSYQDAARMAVGAKIDVVEDTISDIAYALAELCVQNMTTEDVAAYVGDKQAAKWQQMDLREFRANYTFECVAGTTEKPNSLFKKKEAIQIAQSIGQFASAAPITSMTIMLKVLQKAFTEVNIQPEDWDMLKQEATANMQKGVSTGGQQPGGGAAPGGAEGQPDIKQQLMSLPDNVKQQVVQMKQQGASDDQIKQFLMKAVQGGGGAPQPAPQQQAAPQPQTGA